MNILATEDRKRARCKYTQRKITRSCSFSQHYRLLQHVLIKQIICYLIEKIVSFQLRVYLSLPQFSVHLPQLILFWGSCKVLKFQIYRVQSKVVRRPFSLQPSIADVYFQLQNQFKKCKDLCYGIFKFQKSIL